MTFQQEDSDQQIRQFLGVISYPSRQCLKIWRKIENKLKSDPEQARRVDSTNTISIHDVAQTTSLEYFYSKGENQIQLPSLAVTHHQAYGGWSLPDHPNQKRPQAVSSYHIYKDGSYKKCSQAYRPAHPDRIAAGASIIIAPRSEVWRDKQLSPLLSIHIKDFSTIGAQSMHPMELMAIVAALQLAARVQTPTTKVIVIDSLGYCQIANRRQKHPHLTNNYVALMNP